MFYVMDFSHLKKKKQKQKARVSASNRLVDPTSLRFRSWSTTDRNLSLKKYYNVHVCVIHVSYYDVEFVYRMNNQKLKRRQIQN